MRLRKGQLVLAALAGLLIANLGLAGGNPLGAEVRAIPDLKVTIINKSGFPDHQVYLAFTGILLSDNNYHHLVLPTPLTAPPNFPVCLTGDNTVTINDRTYADYCASLDQLRQDTDGHHWFWAPLKTKGTRLYISFQKKVYFKVLDPGFENPSVENTSLPGYATVFDWIEIACDNDGKVNANTTNVDYFCMPLVYELKNGTTSFGRVGLDRSRKTVLQALRANPLLKKLETPYRFYSPKEANIPGAPPTISFPADYYNNYIDYCWEWYKTHPLTMTVIGVDFTGTVDSSNVLTFSSARPAETHTINKPTGQQIFACDGVFNLTGPDPSPFRDRDGQIKNEVASALNRTVMHLAFSEWANVGKYYQQNNLALANYKTNIYSHILHQLAIQQLIYGFPYDDKYEQSSSLAHNPATDVILTINNSITAGMPPVELLLLD